MDKRSAIVCLPWNKGQKKVGTQEGALWIAEYIETNTGRKVNEFMVDQNLDIQANFLKMYQFVSQYPSPYLFCGGDHSQAISTVLAVANSQRYNGKKIGVLWVDAHADINTYQASLTKNYHGMPLSFICGLEKKFQWVNKLKTIPLQNLMYYGIRDLDQFEKDLIEKEGIRHVKVEEDYTEIFRWLEQEKFEVVHLSFDIDVMDPIQIPSTGTTAPNGLHTDKICKFFREIRKVFKDLNIEWNAQVVEFNPLLGGEEGRKTTEDNLRVVLDALFK